MRLAHAAGVGYFFYGKRPVVMLFHIFKDLPGPLQLFFLGRGGGEEDDASLLQKRKKTAPLIFL